MLNDLLAGIAIGLAGGFSSGLLGVSPGGALVVFSVLMLGAEQHVAQGISLAAQIPPTGLGGIRRYRDNGERIPRRWLVLLAIGFLAGGGSSALAANCVSGGSLRWAYVVYLVGLEALLLTRGNQSSEPSGKKAEVGDPPSAALVAVGAFAGLSSGFLGIGGGLATTVGLSAALGVPQRRAQMASLMLALIPTTAPAVWVYWREGAMASAPALLGVVLGLIAGTDLGARLANKITGLALRATLIAFVGVMAAYMAYKAVG